MSERYDVVVIGSGFGGAVMACRLAERGAKVLVLERGRRWHTDDYPRGEGDAWIYDPDEPERQNGWIDLRVFPHMTVVQGAGVGGGSLIYANVSVEAPEWIFEAGWPPEITAAELAPYNQRVAEFMSVQEIPDGQLTTRFRLLREGAEALGEGHRFRKLPLAVSFDPDYRWNPEDPRDESGSRTFVNAQGQEQGTCVHLADCDIGCKVKAKNTLDLNYLPWAEKHGAEIRPLHLVRSIEPEDGGYRVHFERLEDGRREPGSVAARRVVVAAGSLGSTELLLRCRDQHRTLGRLSPRLGHGWSSNGDFLTPAFYDDREIDPTVGPTITAAIDFLDGSRGGRFFIEDGGFPPVGLHWLTRVLARGTKVAGVRKLLQLVLGRLREAPPFDNVMPWFAQGIDAADGRLYLGRKWYAPWRRALKLDWDVEKSAETIDAIVEMHRELARATGGDPWVPPAWRFLKDLITPHPLGGCNLGSSPEDGVVDHLGRVFGHPGLYVVDGAIVPEAIGRNPTRTIAALAERAAEHFEL